MSKTKLTNLRGGQGPVGSRGPIGLPGVNAVANDTANAGYIREPTSQTRSQLEQSFSRRPVMLETRFMWNLPAYKAALASMVAGTRDVKILCVGDSTTTGKGSSNAAISQRTGYPFRLAYLLGRQHAPSTVGLVVPQIESNTQQANDTRVTLGVGWSRAVGFAFGAVWRTPGNSSAVLTVAEDDVQANAWDIYYLADTSTSALGTIVASATGGSAVTVATGGQATAGVKKMTVTAPTASNSNVLTIRNSDVLASHQIYIVGVEAYRTTGAKSIRVSNVGISGAGADTWVAVTGNAAWTGPEAIKAYAPDLTIIDLGINDASAGRTTAAFMADMATLIAAAKSVGSDVVIKTMVPSLRTFHATEAAYVTALKALALPTVNLFEYFGDPQNPQDAGFMFDDLHPNDAGYERVAEYVLVSLPKP